MSSSLRRVLIAAAMAAAGCAAAQAPAPEPIRAPSAFTLDSGHPRTPEQLAMQINHADLQIRVMPDTRTIAATATHEVLATEPLERLVFELDRNLSISEIRIDQQPLPPSAWSNPDGRLTITLPAPAPADSVITVGVDYAGAPHVARNAPWDGGFVWGKAPDGQPWIATAVQGEGCDLFWPCIDHPRGEPRVMTLAITAPPGLSAPSNGRLLGIETGPDGWTTWSWRAAFPDPYGIALNIGPYVELAGEYESGWGNVIPLHFWHLPRAGDEPETLFAEFAEQLEFYERLIGPYPFSDEKMGVAETPHLGMEHQTINAYGNNYAVDANGFDWLLHHELAHEWFGNQMTNADWDHMWLHEGFATYMQPLYARYLHGERNFQDGLQAQRVMLQNRRPLVSGETMTAKTVYSDEVGPGQDLYYKGALVLHTLRMLIGDEAFWAATRQLVYGRPDPAPGNFSPQVVVTEDFIAAVNEMTGADLRWFFDAYVFQAALPELVATRQGDRMQFQWVTGNGGVFPMPIEVEVDGRVHTLPMTGGRGELAVNPGAHVLIDPASKVLRRSPAIERYQQWLRDQAA